MPEPMEEENDTSSSNEEESSSKPCASLSAAEKKATEEVEAQESRKRQAHSKDTRIVSLSSKASEASSSSFSLSHAQEMSMADAEFLGTEHFERAPPILPSRFYDAKLPEDQVVPERPCGFQWNPFGHHITIASATLPK